MLSLCASDSFNIFTVAELLLSLRIVLCVPLSVHSIPVKTYSVKNFNTVRVSVFLQLCAVGHLLKWSIATKTYTSPRALDLNGQTKSYFISWFGSVKSFRLFTSVSGKDLTLVCVFDSYLLLCNWVRFRISPVSPDTIPATRMPPAFYPFLSLMHRIGVAWR